MTKGVINIFSNSQKPNPHPNFHINFLSKRISEFYNAFTSRDNPILYTTMNDHYYALSDILSRLSPDFYNSNIIRFAINTAISYHHIICVITLFSLPIDWDRSFLNTAVLTNSPDMINIVLSKFWNNIYQRDVDRALCDAAWYGVLHSAKCLCDTYNASVDYNSFKPIRAAAKNNKKIMIQYLSSQL